MPKITLVCGKICSGKTTYSKKLIEENQAVLLSCDEIMLDLFGQYCGDKHEEIAERTMKYLFKKSLELCKIGTNVILDLGFWSKSIREETTEFYIHNGITPEWHYVDVSNKVWLKNVENRNKAVEKGETNAYYVDENIARTALSIFEVPTSDEIDIWYKNDWH